MYNIKLHLQEVIDMKPFLAHEDALRLEGIVRKVFNCDRFGVMGIADADHLERYPLDAVWAVFAPLYQSEKSFPDIEDFTDKYSVIFHYPEEYVYSSKTIKEFIEEFDNLVKKHIF